LKPVEQIFTDQVAARRPFVLYADPNEDQLICLWDDITYNEVDKASFIFRAFDEKSTLLQVRGDHRIKLEREHISLRDNTIHLDAKMDEGYAQMIQAAGQLFEHTPCEKIVLSRIKETNTPPNFTATKMAMALQGQYPLALTYLLYHPSCGTWIGSTPETLVNKTIDDWSTMALAGTRPLGQQTHWSQKDIAEHEYVCDHIDKRLAEMGGLFIEKGARETIAAGPVEHLLTSYRFKFSGDLRLLVDLLHPTPAICGTPKELSYQKILELESHDRELYSGFIGPVSENKTHLFVNLRCMKLEGHKASLFVGGGITRDSDPTMEWKETEMKAQTLMKVMQNL
jgi:isochorismate synthase